MNNAWLPAISFRVDLRKTNLQNPESIGWTPITSLGKLPAYISVYRSPEWIESTKAKAFIAVVDTKKSGKLKVLGNALGKKTLNEFYDAEKKKPSILLNGGYFSGNESVSLICKNGKLLANNIAGVIRSYEGKSQTYYPTRSVFSLSEEGNYRTDWVYTVKNIIYAYSVPALNSSNRAPLPVPSKGFPKGATEWNAEIAIGGGPVLIKDATIRNSWVEEMYDVVSGIDPQNCHPRSAIGVTGDGKLIFFVCEGRNQTPEVPGMTLDQVARVMRSLGCIEALNLDGGGSSCMLINGKEVIKSSEKGHKQRSVVSAIAIN